MTREKYQEYLQSDHWKDLRRMKLEQSGRECKICGSKKDIEVHHLQYHNIYDVCLGDLLVLCRYCHNIHHAFKTNKIRKRSKKYRFLLQERAKDIMSLQGFLNKKRKYNKKCFKAKTEKLIDPYKSNYYKISVHY